jgi:hypothetical protein
MFEPKKNQPPLAGFLVFEMVKYDKVPKKNKQR